jgi:hypothetical protein
LIYLPSIETFAYAPSVRFGERDLLNALYVSGSASRRLGSATSSLQRMPAARDGA